MAFNNKNMLYITLFFACCVAWSARVECMNVLAIQAIGGLSHWVFMSGVLRVLVDSGNNVTVFTPFLDGNRENYTEVDISDDFAKGINVPLDMLQKNFTSPLKSYRSLRDIGITLCQQMYTNVKIMEVLDRPTEFDLVIIEPLWSDCMSYVAVKMNLPLLYLSSFSVISFKESSITGGHSNPFEYANVLLPYSIPRTYSQKMENLALFLQDNAFDTMDSLVRYIYPKVYDPLDSIPPSAVLINSHTIIEKPRPSSRKVINIGGIHLETPKRLPADVEEFLNTSVNGAIYLAFGATIKISTLPKYIFKELIAALEELPVRVLLKYEDDAAFNSLNILVRKWFPQRDVLVHPNVKLFISHGGMCGIMETLDAGIPVVGIPFIGDQLRNINNLVEIGMAVSIPFSTVTKENIKNSILEVLNNKMYAENAKTASALFKKSAENNRDIVINSVKHAVHNKVKTNHLEFQHPLDL